MRKSLFLILIYAIVVMIACTPKAQKYYSKAEEQFKQKEYQHAIENYQQAAAEGYDAGKCNYYTGEAYRRSNRIQEAEQYYKKAIDAGNVDEEVHFFYGMALKANGKYEAASKQFQQYAKNGTNFDYINRAKSEVENIKKLEDLVGHKSKYRIENAGPINTENAEYAPIVFDDKLYFTSNRDATQMHAASGTGFTDIYEYAFDGLDKHTGQAVHMGNVVNTDDAHEANCIFTKDGQTMIFARGNDGAKKKAPDVDIFITKRKKDGTWSEPTKLPFCDSLAWDASPALSLDEKTLYFSSNREGGMGNTDLYKVTKDDNGNWTNVENLGAPYNTKGNEMFPYVSPYNGMMYFSSDGHVTFGQLDIVYAKEVNGKMTIENIGQPLNTSFDDFGIVFRDTTSGYFVSNRPDGEGDDDIYHFYDDRSAKYCIDGLALGSAKKNPEYVLPGTKVYLLAENGDTIARTVAADSGKFELCDIKPNTQFYLVAQKDGYFNQTKEFYVPVKIDEVPFADLEPGENIIKKKATVKLVKLEQIVIVRNILYDYDKWNIRPDAALELDKIVDLMANNPQIKIELGSHTDDRGSLEYNQKLSQKRAESAVKYIISKGIASDRIFAKGYGESEPAIKNAKTEEEHQTNRRTTFKVLNHFDDALEIKVE